MSGMISPDQIFACIVSGVVGAFAGGLAMMAANDGLWRFLQKRRELQHAERMAIIEQRNRLLGTVRE